MKAENYPNEAARLTALRSYGILDTEAEAEFDEITRVVSEVCGMPVSLISLVDEKRQWFKARTGVDLTETPLEMSVCAHGILQPELLEIEDMTKDVRTIDNPLVAGEPHARFYAGAALTDTAGYPIGMLCVLDYQPRKLTQPQRDLLSVMARLVMRQMELRKILKSEQNAHGLVQEILDKANVLLARNDMLRREIDHRVKNSLSQISGFLRLQERRHAGQPLVTGPLADARNRVVAMAQIHDHLHRSADDDEASVRAFLTNLAEQVSQNRPPQLKEIRIESDDTKMPSDRVVAIGLAVNEFISNSMKHAFPAGHDGIISVGFQTEGRDYVLRMADNGVGLPKDFDLKGDRGLGMRVIASLAQQLSGTVVHDAGEPGTVFVIRFPTSGPTH